MGRPHISSGLTIGHGMDVYGCRSFVGCFFVFLLEFCLVPGVVAEGSVADSAGVDDDLFGKGTQFEAAEVGGCGLQCVEEERGFLVIDLVGEEEAHALH